MVIIMQDVKQSEELFGNNQSYNQKSCQLFSN